MLSLEEEYPHDVELCKAANLLYDTAQVSHQQGPLPGFLGAFADRETPMRIRRLSLG